jgi:two-component system phosphate regulon sensor histidine kinase PhoR
MEKRKSIVFFGITALIILIAVQVFIVRGIWKQKDEMFDLRYKSLSQEALVLLERRRSTDGFDTARYLISRFSEQMIQEGLTAIKDEKELASKKRDILDFVTMALNSEQDLSPYLSSYFERQRFEKNFNFIISINYLEIIDFDTRIPIYESEHFINRKSPEGRRTNPFFESHPSRILVHRYFTEDNHYRLSFDFYIDFSDKQALILKETYVYLAISILSIVFVVVIFLVTYMNLMEEKRLSTLKTDFINNMTHELKTPLSTITVAGKTLEMEQIRSDEAKIIETAKLIGKQSIHLNQLINMILEISMWERTQFQLDKKTVRIEDALTDIVDSFKTGCGNCAVINQKYNLKGIETNIDLVYFTTMVNNLLSNAVKYSDKDPVIEVEGFTETNKIVIKVSDNGIGIGKTDQKHIFDKFYRSSQGNIHKYKGLGLGLYYVKKIAESHGGDVTVDSKPGKGSIFTITIPY